MADLYCPYCGSRRFHQVGERYECDECQWLFDEDDIKWQELRHEISRHLIDTDEEHPIVFTPNGEAVIGEYWDDTIGLSTNEMYHCDRIFQVPGDGRIWYHLVGEYDKSDPTGLLWRDIEDENFLDLQDLQSILDALEWRFDPRNYERVAR